MDDVLIHMMRWGQQGYSCSQILLLMAMQEQGQSNPDLVRTMAGLAFGCGSGHATCGTLTGGCCLLAFKAVDKSDPAQPSEQLPMMLQELTGWFEARIGSSDRDTTCSAIVGEGGAEAARQTCAQLVGDTYTKVMEILADYGVDG